MSEEKKNAGKQSALQAWLNRKKKASKQEEIQVLDEKTPTVLSYGQQRLWLLQQLFPENPFYQYSHLYRFSGLLDLARLERAFQEVVARHSILRTQFIQTDEGVRQFAQTDLSIKIHFHDLRELPEEQRQTVAKNQVAELAARPFDLSEPPLFRLNLFQLAEDQHWLLFDVHHIVGDRWSLEIINEEIATIYRGAPEDALSSKPSLPFQYADYARHQQFRGIADQDLQYWLENLSGELPNLPLPQDFQRPAQPTFGGSLIHHQLPERLSKQLIAISRKWQTTPYVLFLAAFKALLYRYTGQQDILVGSPFSNRDKAELEKLVGFFNETLVLRSEVKPDRSFGELVASVKSQMLQALAHRNVPFDTLVQRLRPERTGTYNPLFQVMFLYNTPVPEVSFGKELQVEDGMFDLGTSKFDLTLYVNEQPKQLQLGLEYSTDLFSATTAERMLAHLEILLEGIARDPDQPIQSLPIIGPEERQKLLFDWNDTAHSPATVQGIHELLEEQAQSDQTAVIFGEDRLSYTALDQQATQLAHQLRKNGVANGQIVGLYCQRSVALFVGIFGILKAGAAYLPLDPEYPEERIRFMMEDSGATCIVTQQALVSQLPSEQQNKIIVLEAIEEALITEAPLSRVEAAQPAYIIYTSGSTGQPKGVSITHRNLIHSTTARFDFYPENPTRFLLLSSFSFDSSVAGIFWTLCSGGTLVLPPQRIEQDIDALARLIEKQQVTHTLLLPSLYNLLLQHSETVKLNSLQGVIVAGEACPSTTVEQHFRQLPGTRLYNEYGPTEATVWCIAHQIRPEDAGHSVPIGRPIANTQAFVLDAQLAPVPIGVPGELYIAGAGLSEGYLNRPELTRERFLPIPFPEKPKRKMYKTGDLVRYRNNGVLEYLGRTDHQIKIRGHRVEPEEIANYLLENEAVSEAVVLTKKSGKSASSALQLIAYITGSKSVDSNILKRSLSHRFPAYMVPSGIMVLDKLPRLPNGKINRKALPEMELSNSSAADDFEPPTSELEIQLAEVWQEVLGLKQIGIHANFFEIGGDSLLSIQVVALARRQGIELGANQLFQHQTIAQLAAGLEEAANFSSLVPLRSNGSEAPFFCIHSGGGHVFFYQSFARHLSADRPVYALQPAGLDGKQEHPLTIEEMAAAYILEIREVQSEGPYHILGTCFSNAVALEMSNQLQAAGEQVELYIIDSGPLHLIGDEHWGKRAPFRRFVDLLKRGDFSRIKRKVLNRIRPEQKTSATWEAISADRDLRGLVENLNEAYARYSWKPFPGKIHFIRSSEFHERRDKKYHLQQWNKLAGGGLDVHVVPGHHLTLFEEPEVKGLAHQINECLAHEVV